MASLSSLQVVTLVLVSSSLSVASTFTLMRYVPELAAMPVPEPDIQLMTYAGPASLICEAHTDSEVVEELSTSFSTRRKGNVLIILSTAVSYITQRNDPGARAFIYMNVHLDGRWIEPHEVCLTYISESPGMPQTVVFHAEGLEEGTHNLRFNWKNNGAAEGVLNNPALEIMIIPNKSLI